MQNFIYNHSRCAEISKERERKYERKNESIGEFFAP